ncbi:alkaline phosphatase family protein [Bifidobacterium vespertilionis]|uniref:Nucleotide pyrophosphatase n=1 Tax=Bifidobacterium vespertilionis TaxID=2562524 RepID=A0A5J5DUM2_9BIFI|nr:nucleotide pyrophosphatase/phosphodiesterase family protein [Bifidobacterium vespertilionis]KAA8820063.1 nucleotide pyrophosphatase [Bifidobacterium vespertilionis]KAA8822218.1 nucleotide pyrophosphatase [Bifidobacterium vespertilionis]
MAVEVPETEELLRIVPTAHYGDDATESSRNATESSRGGARHLSAVLPAVTAAIGHPVPTAVHADPKALQRALGLPDVRSAIVVLVDGLGFWNLNMRIGHAPCLRSLVNETINSRPISTCAPSTTVAAMATFGTGTCPGLTGMTGYTQRNTETGELSQLIQFKNAIPPLELQRQPTIFETLAAAGVRVTSSGLPKFANSPLTIAAFRGAAYVSDANPTRRVTNACEAARTPGLTYLYIRDADKVGHNYGWDSEHWVAAFERIDAQLALLRRSAPKGTLIVIVADHGMVGVDPAGRIDIAGEPELARDVAMVGGEPRSLMLYADDGVDPRDIAARWRERLGDKALVRLCDDAVRDGVYGPMDPRVRPMIGDVLVQAAGAVTIVDSRIQNDKATHLPSVHGSQTALEMDIPCLIDLV